MTKRRALKINHAPQQPAWLEEKPFKGVDWSTSLLRPGCQDHLKYKSRRGDTFVPHQPPIHGCAGMLRDRSSTAGD